MRTFLSHRVTPDRFEAFYEAHADQVFRFCLRLSGNCQAEAEDLAQEVMLAALQALPRFAGKAQVTTWLYTITVRTYRKRITRGEPSALSLSEEGVSTKFISQPSHEDTHLLHLSIAAALAALPAPLREAFVLVKAEGFTHKEAARILELPQGTIQARVHEAARRLRVVLTEEEL